MIFSADFRPAAMLDDMRRAGRTFIFITGYFRHGIT